MTELQIALAAVRLYAETHPRPTQVTQTQAAQMLGLSRITVGKPAFQQTITGGCAAFHCFRSTICASIIYLDVFELIKRGDFLAVEK